MESSQPTNWGEVHLDFGYSCGSKRIGEDAEVSTSGFGDVAAEHPFTERTRINCGSIGKLATGYLATKVWPDVDERSSTRLGALIPNLPAPHGDVTIEDCLVHATGLWDFRSLMPLLGRRSTQTLGLADVFEITLPQRAVDPAFREQYSNTNYFLVGVALESAVGKPLSIQVQEALGNDVGNFVFSPRDLVPRRARGYERVGSTVVEVTLFVDGHGASNYWADAAELCRLAERVTGDYTSGLAYGCLALDDGRFYASGEDGGCRASILIDVEQGSSSVALTNGPETYPAELLRRHRGATLGSLAPAHVKPPPATRPVRSTELSGRFRAGHIETPIEVKATSDSQVAAKVGNEWLDLDLTEDGTYSDGHVAIYSPQSRPGLVFDINHATGIPLERLEA